MADPAPVDHVFARNLIAVTSGELRIHFPHVPVPECETIARRIVIAQLRAQAEALTAHHSSHAAAASIELDTIADFVESSLSNQP